MINGGDSPREGRLFRKPPLPSLLTAILIAAITLAAYLPTLQNGFVNWDDDRYVYENGNIRLTGMALIRSLFSDTFSVWHPLTTLSHAIDYSLWGLDPWGFHLTNILFHAANTLLVFLLFRRLLAWGSCRTEINPKGTLLSSAVIALLFGLHPIHVESVAWITERKDLLYAFFFLLSLFAYMRYILSSGIYRSAFYCLSLFLFLLSLMSKPMAVTLPALLLLLDYFPFRRHSAEKKESTFALLLGKIPFFLLSMMAALVTLSAHEVSGALRSVETVPLLSRLIVSAHGYIFYLYKILFPLNLAPFYPYPDVTALFTFKYGASFVIFVIITGLSFYSFRKKALFASLWFYYVISLLPVIGLFQAGAQAAADRFTYLPSLAPFALAGLGMGHLWHAWPKRGRQTAMAAFLILMTGAMIAGTVKQSSIWRDAITLWTHEIKLFPDTAFAYNNLGSAYLEMAGNTGEAMRSYDKAIELDPNYAMAYYNRGTLFGLMEQHDRAVEDMNSALSINPGDAGAFFNRGVAQGSQGNYAEAIDDLSRAISINPAYDAVYKMRGIFYYQSGHDRRAISDYEQHLRLNPGAAETCYNLSLAYTRLGDQSRAAYYRQQATNLGFIINPQ